MSALLGAMQGAAAQGVLWGIMVLGVYITYKLLDIADLTVDGSFALGGCVCAILVANKIVDPVTALFLSAMAGVLAGAVTGILHTLFEIPAILAGILTQIALWSVNLRVMGGKSNVPLLKEKTLISGFVDMTGMKQSQGALIIGIIVAVATIAILYWFFGTEIGCSIRATGSNQNMSRAQGINTDFTKILGLMISNGIVAFASGLYAQYQGFADVNAGRGAIVIGLAAVIIGEVVFGKISQNFGFKLFSVAFGAIIYYLVLQVVLWMGLNSNDLKLLSALVVAVFLAIP